MKRFIAISLFSGGIGGLDIAAEAAGFDVLVQVEIDEFNRQLLRQHHPNAIQFPDVRHVGRHNLPTVDLIFGGFPCQPHSLAGSRKGEDDSRNFWPELARIIGELRPRVVLLENVPGILSATRLDNGEIRAAYALTVIKDLQQMGYVGRAGTLSAAEAGAPHKRERWFCVAYADGGRYNQPPAIEDSGDDPKRHLPPRRSKRSSEFHAPVAGLQDVVNPNGGSSIRRRKSSRPCDRPVLKGEGHGNAAAHTGNDMGNTHRAGCKKRHTSALSGGAGYAARRHHQGGRNGAAQCGLGRYAHGSPGWLLKPRWPGSPGESQHRYEPPRTTQEKQAHRAARLRALGNGVVPQVAYPIFEAIYEALIASATP